MQQNDDFTYKTTHVLIAIQKKPVQIGNVMSSQRMDEKLENFLCEEQFFNVPL